MIRPKLPAINEPAEYPPMEYDVLSGDVKDAPFRQTVASQIRWSRTLAIGIAVACLFMLVTLIFELAGLAMPQKFSTQILRTIIIIADNATMIGLNVFSLVKIFRYSAELQRAMRLNTKLEDLEPAFKTSIVIQKIGFATAMAMILYYIILWLVPFL